MKNLTNTAEFIVDFAKKYDSVNKDSGNDNALTFKDFKRFYSTTFLLNKIKENNYLLYIFDREKLLRKVNENKEIGNVILKTYRNTDILDSGLFDDLLMVDHWKGFDNLIEEIHCFYKPDVDKKQFDEWLDLMKQHNYMDQKEIEDVLSYVYFEKEEYNNYLN